MKFWRRGEEEEKTRRLEGNADEGDSRIPGNDYDQAGARPLIHRSINSGFNILGLKRCNGAESGIHALNAQYALDHANADFIFLCVYPGWLKTDLGGADLDVEVGVTELKKIILEPEKTENGKFLNIPCSWAGKVMGPV
ncbi:hypothetical protein OIDMADRAFT_57248 [Oidiodendron maius Zn]|uniref:Uncharacterized protein n=1 Tax=Oidiodendron maius (strain Zn) TaxID=913774 RepID=A0A0C3GNW3_OIDMZ|nr:hypothetical protein OIDMADRAFT_57248 [Oidiodendron maius Zn]